MRETGLTRRELLCGAVIAAVGWPLASAHASGLAAIRAGTYRALVRACGARHARPASRDFDRWYAGQDAVVRAHAGAVLDRLTPLTPARLAADARPERAALLAAALGLVAIACAPPPGEDERPAVMPA